jgi:hypothetical protein
MRLPWHDKSSRLILPPSPRKEADKGTVMGERIMLKTYSCELYMEVPAFRFPWITGAMFWGSFRRFS